MEAETGSPRIGPIWGRSLGQSGPWGEGSCRLLLHVPSPWPDDVGMAGGGARRDAVGARPSKDSDATALPSPPTFILKRRPVSHREGSR